MSEGYIVPTAFEPDMKVGDEMKLLGQLVRIEKIELVVHVKNVDKVKPQNLVLNVTVPLTDFNIPFSKK